MVTGLRLPSTVHLEFEVDAGHALFAAENNVRQQTGESLAIFLGPYWGWLSAVCTRSSQGLPACGKTPQLSFRAQRGISL